MPSRAQPQMLLDKLEACKGRFGRSAARATAALLRAARHTEYRSPKDLIRLHETVLFLRAHPQDATVLKLADGILFSFARRTRNVDAAAFEDPDTSGIAGTSLSTIFSYSFARPLAEQHGEALSIDWDAFEHPERLAFHLAHRIPAAFEDWAIAPHADWRANFESAGGTVPWLLEGIQPEVYDLLEIPLHWQLRDSDASRSRARLPETEVYYHQEEFLTRRDISLHAEFAKPAIAVTRLSKAEARAIFRTILNSSAVRYRELYGFEYPELDRMYHAHLGRGVDIYFLSLDRKWRLPHREYCSGMYFKNGVPMGYVEVMWLEERMEVGFNLYYTFRQGETAWLYARLLKLFKDHYRVREFFIDPYQLGHENAEAIESGAFWFYYKLGFRSESESVQRIAERELVKIGKNAAYRTSNSTLKTLASAPLCFRP